MTGEKYDGVERRQYCSQHCIIDEQVKRSVPRWVFTTSLSTIVVIALAFAGWQVSSITQFRNDIQVSLNALEERLDERMNDLKDRYHEDVGRFYRAAERNERLLNELNSKQSAMNVRISQVVTKQDLVIKKVKLTE